MNRLMEGLRMNKFALMLFILAATAQTTLMAVDCPRVEVHSKEEGINIEYVDCNNMAATAPLENGLAVIHSRPNNFVTVTWKGAWVAHKKINSSLVIDCNSVNSPVAYCYCNGAPCKD